MKKVFKFVKGKKDERKESGGMAPSQSGDFVSPAQTPEEEGFLGMDNSSGYDVDFGGKDKTLTKLHKAAWQGNLEKLKSALKKVEVDAVDRRNRTALHFAVAQGHPNIVWFLLGNNAKTSISDDEGHTPLLKAIQCGHKDCMTLLLDRGANVNAADYSGNTGLHVAVDRSSLDTASALLKKGADTEVSNNAGDYPLHIATRSENKDLVDLLLAAGASVDVLDRENRTPLMLAAKTGNCVLARIFVDHGAQLTVVDSNGWTAQDYAMLGGHENVSLSLKSFSKNNEKKTSENSHKWDLVSNEHVGSCGGGKPETGEKGTITPKGGTDVLEKCSEGETGSSEKEKADDLSESPDANAIPPYCQPPRSWEMIQAGMIDENINGIEGKRRSITTLGTLHSRRESFAEGSASSPQFTLSLNRRKGAKTNNSFAKQRFSFNEEESLTLRTSAEKMIRKDLEGVDAGEALAPGEAAGHGQAASDSDWDSASEERSGRSGRKGLPGSEDADSAEVDGHASDSGTLGRTGTMQGTEEVWVSCPRSRLAPEPAQDRSNSWDSEDASSEKEGGFPPPPTALELGIDMAKSIKYMKGMSVDRPPGCAVDRNLWISARERHSLDCLEERDFVDVSRGNGAKIHGRLSSAQKAEEILKCSKPCDRFIDVSKRINEELECYDQALRELAESAGTSDKFPSISPNYHSLPTVGAGSGCESKGATYQGLASDHGSPHSLPPSARLQISENDGKPVPAVPDEKSPADIAGGEKAGEKLEKRTKRHMLLAMRDVKHAVHVANTFKTSMDDQILSPLAEPENDSGDEASPKGVSGSSGGNSPPDENPFFGIGRQETVLERNGTGRKSSSSGTGEESTLWLQDGARRAGLRSPDSDDDVSEIVADDGPKHRRASSFSPLGLIQREMEEEEEETGAAPSPTRHLPREENDEQQEENLREQSPDVSLSSGPIEPIGAEKDSGSDPESSHNDASPTRNYALQTQHEWLKCHLKAATSEKNKLEELSAQLAEKAERLQYELADAKEAAKSRDEVIRLLQGQLARMEAAYTKSLEESVQSRLQLTSHEQEILHLKELCFRYEEEKEAAEAGMGSDVLQELRLRIKTLEGEKEKMREEIMHLEEERSQLEKKLKQGKDEESEMMDECQRWKERCRELEELTKAEDCKNGSEKEQELSRQEIRLGQQHFVSEKKFLELGEENAVLRARIRSLTADLEAERKKASAIDETHESIAEVKRKNLELESHMKKLEKEMEENLVKKLKEKEEEVEILVKQFDRERDALVASYEKKLTEGKPGLAREDEDEWQRGSLRLRQVVESLREQMLLDGMRMSASVEDANAALKREVSRLKNEWNSVCRTISEGRRQPPQPDALVKENLRPCREVNGPRRKPATGESQGGPGEADLQSEILELKSHVNSLRALLDGASGAAGRQKNSAKPEWKSGRRGVGKEDELAWGNLYGMMGVGRRRSGTSTYAPEASVEDGEEGLPKQSNAVAEQDNVVGPRFQKLDFLDLKKEILHLQSKMLDEKNLRHALENQMMKMNMDMAEKDNLEKEVNSLKKKVDGNCLRESEFELLRYQKDLEERREKYLAGTERDVGSDSYRAKCEVWAKEIEKTKEMSNSFHRRAASFDCPPPEVSPHLDFHHRSRPRPEILQPRLMTLDTATKSKLERELDRSIRKYVQSESRRSS